jgi:hypothetical protein
LVKLTLINKNALNFVVEINIYENFIQPTIGKEKTKRINPNQKLKEIDYAFL